MSDYSQSSSAAASSFAPTSTGTCSKFNCSTAIELKSNPDISGIGVLLGFAISAYLTLFFCAAYYWINIEGASNPVDRLFLDNFSPKTIRRISKKWSEALQNAVLTLGDSQVVTGISILVSGYIQLACGLQLYHWLIVVDLAFFSSVTHLTTLTCLRSYLQERPAIRLWRLISMGIIAVLLAVALGSTGYYAAGYTWPAQCFLTHDFANLEGPFAVAYWGAYGYNSLYMGTVLCFLALSYLSRVVQVFPSAQAFMRNLFRSRPSNGMQRCLVSIRNRATASSMTYVSKFWLLVNGLLLSMYCLSEAVADLYGSVLWEITWLALASAWGTIVVWRDRDHRDFLEGFTIAEQMTLSEDNTWGFGQVVPLLLLILPLVSFFEAVYETAFTPAKAQPDSSPDSETTLLTEVPGGRSDPSYSAIPHVSDESITVLTVSGRTRPYHDFYQYQWFRRLIVLIYGLTLGVAGNVLWFFPFLGLSSSNNLQDGIGHFLSLYAPWLAYNFGIVWIFILVSLYVSLTNAFGTAASPTPFVSHNRHMNGSWWTGPAACNILICVLLGSSYAIGAIRFYLWFEMVKSRDTWS